MWTKTNNVSPSVIVPSSNISFPLIEIKDVTPKKTKKKVPKNSAPTGFQFMSLNIIHV